MPFDRQYFDQFTAQNNKGANPAGFLEFRIPHRWLTETGIVIIDTPGAGDILVSQASPVWETVAASEATMMVISALSPLSLTERAFVDEHIYGQKVPKVSVVITHLDQINSDEREEVIQYIAKKVAVFWRENVEVWSAHDINIVSNNLNLARKGPDQIRIALESWANDLRRKQERLAQVLAQLLSLILSLRSMLVAGRQAMEAEESMRDNAVKRATLSLETERMKWEDIRLDFERRTSEGEAWLQQTIGDNTANIVQRLAFEVNRVPNPREWWARELPYRMAQELRTLSKSISFELSRRLERDMQWLLMEARRSFSVQLAAKPNAPMVEVGEDALPSPHTHLADLNRFRITTRLVSIAAGTTGYLLFGPLGILVSGLGQLFAETTINKKIQEQRDESAKLLSDTVYQVTRKAFLVGKDRIREAYRISLEETKEQESTWHRQRLETIAAAPLKSDEKSGQMRQACESVDTLLQRIKSLQDETRP